MLEKLLLSLKNQSIDHKDFEIIIIASPNDKSLTLMNRLTSEFSNLSFYIPENDPYSGRSASFKRNYGAIKAKGTWLAYTDDDCICDQDWLKNAKDYILNNTQISALEGHVNIEDNGRKTLTLKGMKRLQRSGGYQTCNMFYRREDFLNVKGFDLAFPYYLEDTDIAWSFLDNKLEIGYCPKAIITHPEIPADPWKLVTLASRSGQHLRLRAKHPDRYKSAMMTPIRKSQVLYFIISLSVIVSAFFSLPLALMALGILIIIVSTHMLKMYWGLTFSLKELFLVATLTPLVSWIAIYNILKTILGPRNFWINPKTHSNL